jgi:hypothetical protein
MIKRLRIFVVVASAMGCGCAFQANAQIPESNDARVMWVAQALTRMLTIKPGMTRDDLMRVFTTEGGVSTAFQQTLVSRDCPYFKVDVEFQESRPDIILKISRPYLAFSIAD